MELSISTGAGKTVQDGRVHKYMGGGTNKFHKKMVIFLWPKEGFFVPNAPVQWFEKQNKIQKKFFWDTLLSTS